MCVHKVSDSAICSVEQILWKTCTSLQLNVSLYVKCYVKCFHWILSEVAAAPTVRDLVKIRCEFIGPLNKHSSSALIGFWVNSLIPLNETQWKCNVNSLVHKMRTSEMHSHFVIVSAHLISTLFPHPKTCEMHIKNQGDKLFCRYVCSMFICFQQVFGQFQY
jgi:hypothetical protein